MTDPLLGPPNIPLNYDDAWLVKWCYLYILYLDIDLMNTWMNDSCGGVTWRIPLGLRKLFRIILSNAQIYVQQFN